MKLLRKFDLKKAWAWLFFAAFLLVPLCLISESALYAAVIFVLLYLLSGRLAFRWFPILLFLAALGLRIAAIFLIPTPVESDFAKLLNAAQQMNGGDRRYLDDIYFQRWDYQLGFVAFEALLLKIRDTVYVLKLFNCLAGAGTTVLIYLLALELADKRAARIVSVFYCFSPMGVFYMTVLSNQVFPTFLVLAGVYYLVGERFRSPMWVRCAVFGLLLSLANVLRPESIIPLTAAALSILLLLRKHNWKQSLLCLALLLGVYFGMNFGISFLFRKTGLAPGGLVNNAPYWKFVLGFNHDSAGVYTSEDVPLLTNPDEAWETIRQRLDVPFARMYHLFERKISKFWGSSALGWVFTPFRKEGLPLFGNAKKTDDAVTVIYGLNRWFHFAAYVLTLLGTVRLIRRDRLRLPALVLMNIVFITFGVYLLIEIQPRYSFFAQAVCFALSAPGIMLLQDRFRKRRSRQQTANQNQGKGAEETNG